MQKLFVLLLFVLLVSVNASAQSDVNSLMAGAKNDKEVVWYTTTSAGTTKRSSPALTRSIRLSKSKFCAAPAKSCASAS